MIVGYFIVQRSILIGSHNGRFNIIATILRFFSFNCLFIEVSFIVGQKVLPILYIFCGYVCVFDIFYLFSHQFIILKQHFF